MFFNVIFGSASARPDAGFADYVDNFRYGKTRPVPAGDERGSMSVLQNAALGVAQDIQIKCQGAGLTVQVLLENAVKQVSPKSELAVR